MRGCGITPFFCVDKFYIHVDLFYNFTDVPLFIWLIYSDLTDASCCWHIF